MKEKEHHWSKDELKTYILLLCAGADVVEAKEELDLIRSMAPPGTFQRIYAEFRGDDRDRSLEKIRNSMQGHDYSYWELAKLRSGIEEVFASDGSMVMKERNLGKILDGILY
jgi:hypothetical protein